MRMAAAALCACAGVAGAQTKLPPVEVVAPTPVPGLEVPRDRLPANVQQLRSRDLEEAQPLNVPDVMRQRLPSVNLNEIQGNPWQPDVSFRGFTASPLLGTPQGLSMYQDGVRINEPFGDIVNWDLIPMEAIDSLVLVPGSNPLFGLNTLGGALSLRTKSGDTHPGGELEVSGGSFGRVASEFSYGRPLARDMHLFAAGAWFDEEGWRDYSPSRVKQLFAKLGRRAADHEWELALTAANTDLVGNALVPQSFFERRRESIFTYPDHTRNELGMLTFNGSRFTSAASRWSTTLYYRDLNTRTLSGDVDLEAITGAVHRIALQQDGYGGTLQWSIAQGEHQLALGAAFDASRSAFAQTAAAGAIDATRQVLDIGPEDRQNGLDGHTRSASLFATDTWSLRQDLFLTLSARYNAAKVTLRDTGPSAPALDGDHRFSKLNPAAGIAHQLNRALTVYAGFNQGNRVPSPIELGCADPARPCTLPNALAADPPLKQVVARTVEFGGRGRLAPGVSWNAGFFQTANTDDILFVGTTTSAGFFTNFGRTRRRGVELGVAGTQGKLQWNAAYSFVRATFESSACIVSASNSTRGTSPECAAPDLIEVVPGDRIPGIPEHNLKLGLGYRPQERLQLFADLVAFSSAYVRGNENNRHEGSPGRTGGYAVVNARARYGLRSRWELVARVANLFDRRYATAGALAVNPFDSAGRFLTDPDAWTRETFVAPGAPRAGWVGLRYLFKA